MRFLIFNGVVIAALFYLFNADHADLRSAADRAHSAITKAEAAATQVVEKTRDFVSHDEPAVVEKFEPQPVPEPEIEKVEAEPVPPPVPEPVIEKVEAEPAPPPPAPEFVAEAPKRLDPPYPVKDTAPTPVTPKKATRVASAEPVPQEIEEQFVRERPKPTVDYSKVEGRLPTKDPAVAKRQAEVLGGASSPKDTASTKTGEYAIAEGETLMTPRQRRKELSHLAEDMELLFLDKLSR